MKPIVELEKRDKAMGFECTCGELFITTGTTQEAMREVTKNALRHWAECDGEVHVYKCPEPLLKI